MNVRSTSQDEKLAKNAGAFGAATVVSRVLGYARDAGIMFLFGANALTDAYYAAFRISNFFRRTVGEGTVNAAFVPALARENAVSPENGRAFFSAVWTAALVITVFLSLAAVIAAVPLVRALTWGFSSQPQVFGLTVTLTRVLMAQVVFVMLAALCQGALYLSMRFFLPAVAPVTFSLSIIIYLIAAALLPGFSPETRVLGLAVAAVIGSALQLAVLVPAVKKLGYGLGFSNPLRSAQAKTALVVMLPALVCSAGDQISMFAGMFFASFLPAGSITAVYNSTRVMQLPLALFGVAAANSALAQMSLAAQSSDGESFRRTYALALRLTGFMLVPAAAGILVLSLPIVRALFEHGRFSFEQSAVTGGALWWLAFGLVAHGVNKISVMAFYSLSDWKTPLRVILLQTALEAALCMTLVSGLGVRGLALAASVGAWGGAVLLTFFLRRKFGPLGFTSVLRAYLKFAACAVVMAAACFAVLKVSQGLGSTLSAGVAVVTGVAVYGALALAFGFEEAKLFLSAGRVKK